MTITKITTSTTPLGVVNKINELADSVNLMPTVSDTYDGTSHSAMSGIALKSVIDDLTSNKTITTLNFGDTIEVNKTYKKTISDSNTVYLSMPLPKSATSKDRITFIFEVTVQSPPTVVMQQTSMGTYGQWALWCLDTNPVEITQVGYYVFEFMHIGDNYWVYRTGKREGTHDPILSGT